MTYKITSDTDLFIQVRHAIEDNEGYCPCAIEHDEDTRCMCKYFREEVKTGEWCHCGIYQKVEE